MPYIPLEPRPEIDSGVAELAMAITESIRPEEAASSLIWQLLQRYISDGFKVPDRHSPPPPEFESCADEIIRALGKFDDDHIEGSMNYAITTLIGATIPEIRYKNISRAIAILERAAVILNRREYCGDEGVRHGRALSTLRCVELEFYSRIARPYEDEAIAKNGDIPFYEAHYATHPRHSRPIVDAGDLKGSPDVL